MRLAMVYLLYCRGLKLASLGPKPLTSRTRNVVCNILINVDAILDFNTENWTRVLSKQTLPTFSPCVLGVLEPAQLNGKEGTMV